MLKFWNYDIVFAEVPDHTTLAVNLTGCPMRCPGCHSPHLREDVGDPLAVAWYSGRDVLPDLIDRRSFDYIKLGGWVESLGGLASETTNQRMYRILADGTAEDITPRFRR